MTNEEQLVLIQKELTQLKMLMISMIPAHKVGSKIKQVFKETSTPAEVLAFRKEEMLRVFRDAGKKSGTEKAKANFPAPLQREQYTMVPRTLILNWCAGIKVFAPLVEHGEINNMENSINTLKALADEGVVLVMPLDETGIKQDGTRVAKAVCVMTHEDFAEAELEKQALKEADEQHEKDLIAIARKEKEKESKPNPVEPEPKPAQWSPEPEPKPAQWKPIVEDNLCWCGHPIEDHVCAKCQEKAQVE